MPRLKAANNARTTLSQSIDATATSFTVNDASIFPSPPFRITIESEIMEVGAKDNVTNTFSSVQRGLEGTTATSHSNGVPVENRLTAGTYEELATAADLESHLSDTAPHGAVATATPDRLALRDSKGQVVGFVPAARVYHSVAQSIASATTTYLSFDSERFDTDGIHDPVTNNSRLTCQTAGKYFISATILWGSNTTGYRQLGLRLNGVTTIALDRRNTNATAFNPAMTVSTLYNLSAGDYVETQVYQNSGGALDVGVISAYTPEFMMIKVG